MPIRTLNVVPTYNERENVQPLIEALLEQGAGIDVCVADDDSPDGTAAAVREAMARHPGRDVGSQPAAPGVTSAPGPQLPA